jgi:omega-6 fatty acid desaturase (delta-12 desaturase)
MCAAEKSRNKNNLVNATRNFTQENVFLSWTHTIVAMLLLCGAFLGTIWNFNLAGQIICGVLTGIFNVRAFVIYHDFEHRAILKKSRPAKILFTIYGLIVLAPTSIWKRSHDYHHTHNSKLFSASIGSYPVMTRKKYLESTPAERKMYLATRHPLTMVFGYFTIFLMGMCINPFRSNPRKHWDSLAALIVHVTLYGVIAFYFGWITALLAMFVPAAISSAIGAYLFYAQHNFPGVTFLKNNGWTYEGAAMDSSSYLKMGPLLSWISGNIGYHHIHHLNSKIPFYRLPEAYRNVPEFQKAKTISLRPKDVVACMKLKLWDSAEGKMIQLKELAN